MDNEIALVREQIDRQIRPGQVGAATLGGSAPGYGATLGGGLAPCVTQREDGARVRAIYQRAKYGAGRYGG
jgi:hypothetical protein